MDNSDRFFANRSCRFYPCHEGIEELNCLFCYCPLYHMEDCPGDPVFKETGGGRLKVCTDCTFPHRAGNYDAVTEILRRGIFQGADDETTGK